MSRPGSVRAPAGVSMSLSRLSGGFHCLARPKSMSFARPESVTITFEGLRSRCTMPCACASARPSAISIARSSARGALIPPGTSADSGRPRTSSMAMKVAPSLSSIS